MTYTQVTALWSGFTGAPGYTRLKFAGYLTGPGATACADRMRAFMVSIAALLPSAATITFSEAAQHYQADGTLVAEVPISPLPAAVVGTSAGSYAGGSGAVVNWLTGAFINGRKVRGRTFLVPLATGFAADGSLASTTITTISNAAATLLGGNPGLVVASGQVPGIGGNTSGVTGAVVPDRSAVLRSRRD